MLRNINFSDEYSGQGRELVEQFFVPCLKQATEYYRAVGYFTSSSLLVLLDGIMEFVRNGAKMKVIASPFLQREDLEAMQAGTELREERIQEVILDQINLVKSQPDSTRALTILNLLFRYGILEFKVAYKKRGMYHEKLGIIKDGNDYVAFIGSGNETYGGLLGNFEHYEIFASWKPEDERRAGRKLTHFKTLWNNRQVPETGVVVIDLDKAIQKEVIQFVDPEILEKFQTALGGLPGDQGASTGGRLWSHQLTAIDTFLNAEAGILEMATGTGKTRTAVEILRQLKADSKIRGAIIVAEGNSLLHQWYHKMVGERLGHVYGNFDRYREIQNFQIMQATEFCIMVMSYDFLASSINQPALRNMSDYLLICDEVHNLGSDTRQQRLGGNLASKFRYRLGLSATPIKKFAETANDFVLREIGPIVFQYGLEHAIRDGILCEFDYDFIPYTLSEEENQERIQLIRRLSRAKSSGDAEAMNRIMTQIAKIAKLAANKLPKIEEFAQANPEILKKCIIFVEEQQYGDKVAEAIFPINNSFHTFYQGDDDGVLRRFSSGNLDYLIAISRISEGIDIPSVENIILLSTDREIVSTTQRVGRCLRLNPNSPDKKARIIDFARIDAETGKMSDADMERVDWLTKLSQIKRER